MTSRAPSKSADSAGKRPGMASRHDVSLPDSGALQHLDRLPRRKEALRKLGEALPRVRRSTCARDPYRPAGALHKEDGRLVCQQRRSEM